MRLPGSSGERAPGRRRDHRPPRGLDDRALFTIFCLIVFSKIAWYDLRVYISPEWRRDFLTAWLVAWTGAQVVFYAYLARPLLREARRHGRLVGFWMLATLPYFVIGLLAGRFGVFYVGDLAH